MTDQEFEERTKTRAEETKAVSEALAILSSDDAHDTFTSTFNFVQVDISRSSKLHTARTFFRSWCVYAMSYGDGRW